jgi:lipoate-protein ligase A
MICFVSPSDDPFLNLALEDYLLHRNDDEVFLLWESRQAVVVGKHQNALAELNHSYVREKGITVARRLTGGGTVFHGPGNLNFTFIRNGEPGRLVDFGRFIRPLLGYLATLGIEAVQGPKNEIMARGKKISGNAEHVFRNRVLHHGTLLFDADLDVLRDAIRVIPGRYIDKAVQSNRTSVMNIAECLNTALSPQAFRDGLFDYICRMEGGEPEDQKGIEWDEVRKLSRSKYTTWEWIYGWSPDYRFLINAQGLSGNLKVHRGVITEAEIHSGHLPEHILQQLIGRLTGSRHEMHEIEDILRDVLPAGFADPAEVANDFF